MSDSDQVRKMGIPREIGPPIKLPLPCLVIKLTKREELREILATLSRHRVSFIQMLDDCMVVLAEDLRELVRELRDRNVTIVSEEEVVDFFFPVTFLGKRAIILSKRFYETLIKRLSEKLGPGYSAILYYIGAEIGRHLCEAHAEALGSDLDGLIKILRGMFSCLGLGRLNVDLRAGKAIVKVYDSFECELFEEGPSSHFVRGLLAGWISAMFGVDVSQVKSFEVKCIAKGDPYCEIVIIKA